MPLDINALRAQLATLHADATAHEDKYNAADAGEPTEADAAAQVDRFAKMDKLAKQIDAAGKLATYAFNHAPEAGKTKAVPVAKPADQIAVEAADEPKPFDRHEFGRALSEWALTGVMPDEYATLTTVTASGAMFPKQVGKPVLANTGSALREAMAAVGVLPVVTDGTADLNIPVITVPTGTDVSETATSGTDNTPTPVSINLKPVPTQSGQAWVSNLELGSLDYDLLTEIVPSLEDAAEARLEQRAFAAVIADAGITQTVATASTSGITYDNLVTLNRKLPRRYDRSKVIILSDDAYTLAEKLVGSDGHPILNRDTQNQNLLRFNGTPVVRSSFLQAFGLSKVVGIVVSFVGAKVRDAGQPKLIRHVDDKDKVDQTGVNLVKYTAFGYDPAAIATLKTPAS